MSTHDEAQDNTETVADFPTSAGPLGLTLRLRRLADRINADARAHYAEMGLPNGMGGHAVLMLLNAEGGMGIATIAERLGIAHPSVSTLVKSMVKKGILRREPYPADLRRHTVELTEETEARMPELVRMWNAYEKGLQAALDAAEGDFMAALSGMEAELKARPLPTRLEKARADA